MKKLVAVAETIVTDAGLLRPMIPYELDLSVPKQRATFEFLFPKVDDKLTPRADADGNALVVLLTAEDAAELLAQKVQHHPDDFHAPVFAGDDTLGGGAGNDTVAAGAGNDTLGGGDDQVKGGKK